MKGLHMIAFVLLIVGGFNWGLIGLGGFMGANWNLVEMIFGSQPMVEWLVYILVGLSALWLAINHKKDCRHCAGGSGGMM